MLDCHSNLHGNRGHERIPNACVQGIKEPTLQVNRSEMLNRLLDRTQPWDMVVIGGGATGVGIAVDAASRGYEVLLLEQADFGKGTSSRSTKLVHGGVRYLEQGNLFLVMEALRERGILRQNAPHLVSALPFVVPLYDWWEAPLYGTGLKVYDILAWKRGFGSSQILSREETLHRLPAVRKEGLRGGIVYYDGLFDDTRLLINLVQTAVEQGATVVNYTQVIGLLKGSGGAVRGIKARDLESGSEFSARAKVVINAAGPFADEIRRLSDPGVAPMIKASQGVHLVFAHSFLSSQDAMLVPHTADRRLMFAIPWKGHILVGTTDTPLDKVRLEPTPLAGEIDLILETAGRYLHTVPKREDVLSVFVGIRPLVGTHGSKSTSLLSRDHTVLIDKSGLISIAGGKWTTYRRMAEDCVNQAAAFARLREVPAKTERLRIHGSDGSSAGSGRFAAYGTDAAAMEKLLLANPSLGEALHPRLSYAGLEVLWATRVEMARTVEDVLARRTRALFLNAQAAYEMAPRTAAIMARELGQGEAWQTGQVKAFQDLARGYMIR